MSSTKKDNLENEPKSDLIKNEIIKSHIISEGNTSFLLKAGVLVFLCLQNSGHALLTRYSQGVMKEKYSSTGSSTVKWLLLSHTIELICIYNTYY